jgi:hypothetical protein
MVSPFELIGLVPKTVRRKKSDEIKRRKQKVGIYNDECDWTVDGSPPIELPYLKEFDEL